MAVEQRPLELENVNDEERFFGGDIVWWCLLLLVSIPILLLGLALTPDTFGFLMLAVGGILAGLAFAQVIMRMPYLPPGFIKSVLIALAAAVVISGFALLFSWPLPAPTATQDFIFKPPIS